MNAIQTHALTRCFKEKTAVDALELTVPEGELFALLGVNGAGKTTTIKLLSGLLAPTSGEAEIFGVSIRSQKVKHLLAVSPQETAVAPNLTVRENLELMAGIADASRREAKARADRMLDEAHLREVAEKRAKALSGGWQRRVSIAMALISEPKLLFLDEPTLGLDVLARRELWQEIEALKGRITIVLTTHYMEEAEQLADRVGIMAAGKLRVCGTPAELLALSGKTRFEDAFVVLAGGAEA